MSDDTPSDEKTMQTVLQMRLALRVQEIIEDERRKREAKNDE